MDIQNIEGIKGYPSLLNNQEPDTIKAKRGKPTNPLSVREKVEISDISAALQKKLADNGDIMEIDLEKVNKMRKLIDSGLYNVDAKKLAQKLLQNPVLKDILLG